MSTSSSSSGASASGLVATANNTNTADNRDYTQNTAAGGPANIQGPGSSTALDFSSSSGNTTTLNQESPQAIAALQYTADTALNSVAGIASTASSVARTATERAYDLATANSGTAANQITKMLIGVGVVAAVIAGLYFFRKK